MNVENRIQAIIANMTNPPLFLWGSVFEQNLILDKQDETTGFPCILMIPPFVEGEVATHGRALHRYIVTLLFVDKIDLLEEQNTTGKSKVQEMRSLAAEFMGEAVKYIDALPQQEGIEKYLFHSPNPDDKMNPEEFFNQFDINVAGYGVTFDFPIVEKIESC